MTTEPETFYFICSESNPRKRQHSRVVDDFATRFSAPEVAHDDVTSTVTLAHETGAGPSGDAFDRFVSRQYRVVAPVGHRRDVIASHVSRYVHWDGNASRVGRVHPTADVRQRDDFVDLGRVHELKLRKGLTENYLVDVLLK